MHSEWCIGTVLGDTLHSVANKSRGDLRISIQFTDNLATTREKIAIPYISKFLKEKKGKKEERKSYSFIPQITLNLFVQLEHRLLSDMAIGNPFIFRPLPLLHQSTRLYVLGVDATSLNPCPAVIRILPVKSAQLK